MRAKSRVMLRVLLNRFHEGPADRALSCFPQDVTEKILSHQVQVSDPAPAFKQAPEKLRQIHYSWLVPAMEKLPVEQAPFVLAALPKLKSSYLSKCLNVKKKEVDLSDFVKVMCLDHLYNALDCRNILPLEFIPETELSKIAYLDRKTLLQICDFLGLYDLADEVRHIIDQKVLKHVYESLTPKMQEFLKQCLHKKEKLSSSPLYLGKWKWDSKELKKKVHGRGVSRLGHALHGQNPNLIWYITHRFDKERGEAIARYAAKNTPTGVVKELMQQLSAVMKFLKLEGSQ